MRTPHTSYRKGTTIRLKLKDGRVIIDKFEDHKSGVMILRQHGRIKVSEVVSCSVYKADAPQA